MRLIHDHLHHWDRTVPEFVLAVDRLTLAKRRWRGLAEDGSEFGFDLDHPLADRDVFAATSSAVYRIAQKPEPVLEVLLGSEPAEAARLGWTIGNLHFAVGISGPALLVADDPALRQLFEREHIVYTVSERVFYPLSGGHHH
jgi:urease accessory protein